jgi:hypothetical protein
MVSYPGDAREPASRVREALLRWHTVRSQREGVGLVVKWWPDDAISDAEYGSDGQAVFNRRVGDQADIVFAVFQQRAGTETLRSSSGTIEEIERAAEAGKPVHVFFPANWVDYPDLVEAKRHLETDCGVLTAQWTDLPDLDGLVSRSVESDLDHQLIAPLLATAKHKHSVTGLIPAAARNFQGRETLRDRVTQAWAEGHGTVALCGDGGRGKTHLAAWFARQARDKGDERCDIVAWVQASSKIAVELGYTEVAVKLGLAEENTNPSDGAAALVNYLSDRPVESWLLILDGLDNCFAEVAEAGLIPATDGSTGRVLATTRFRSAVVGAQNRALVDVGVFSREEAVGFLSQVADLPEEMSADAAALARELGYLPLALSVAAGVICGQRQPPGVFLEQFLAKRSLREGLGGLDPEGYPVVMADAWAATVDHLNLVDPSGATVRAAFAAALLDPAGHPGIVWQALAGSGFVVDGSRFGKDGSSGPAGTGPSKPLPGPGSVAGQVPEMLSRLADYSLVNLQGWWPGVVVSMHPMTALAVQDYYGRTHPAGEVVELISALAEAFDRSMPSGGAADKASSGLFARNLVHLAVGNQDHRLWESALGGLTRRAVSRLGDHGGVSEAVALYQTLLPVVEGTLGLDHPGTLTTRNNLAWWLGRSGRVGEAVDQFEVLLADRTRVLGPDHPDTLTTRNNLALWLGWSGRVGEAIEQFEVLLADRTRVLGPDHPDTLTTRNNLAYWRDRKGDPPPG